MNRQPINLSDNTFDMVTKMAEGNPGAITVLMQLLKRDDPAALMIVLDLDDMNMRGPQIWVGFKDHCKQDIEAFAKAIRGRDAAMVETVNASMGVGEERAVTGGASFKSMAGQRPGVRGMGY